MFLSCILFILACGHAPAGAAAPQDDEIARLREELVKARLENLNLKLRLARLANKPDEELKILEVALDSALVEIWTSAFRELAALPEDRRKAAVPAVLKRFGAGKEAFRVEAVDFLGRAGSPEAESTVIASSADPSPAVRKAAAGALKSASHVRSTETLVRLLADPDREVRLASVDALGVARREPAVRPLVAALAGEKDPLIAEKIVDALGAIGSAAAVDPLLDHLKTAAGAVRWSCINSLGKIGERRAAPSLLPYLEAGQTMEVRLVAIGSIGKLKETAALPRLQEILHKDPEEKLREAAALAFGLMAMAESIEGSLLPAYLEDASETVRRALWTSMLALAGEDFAANERLASALLARGRRPEAEQICAKLHPARPDAAMRARALILEESVARAAFAAGDFKAALPHYRQLASTAPERAPEALRQIAACYRELKDFDSCLKTLGELKDPEPYLEEAHVQLQTAPPDERRKTLDQALRSGTHRLMESLASKDEPARKAALDAVRRLGRKILPALIAELEEGPRLPTSVLEAGSVVTGIPNDAAANGNKAKAAAWRAWLAK